MAAAQTNPPTPIPSDLKSMIASSRRRRTKLFAYGFILTFIGCTVFLAFSPSTNRSSPLFSPLFSSSSFSSSTASSFRASITPYRAQISSFFSRFFPNPSSLVSNRTEGGVGSSKDAILGDGSRLDGAMRMNKSRVGVGVVSKGNGVLESKNETKSGIGSKEKGAASAKNGVLGKNQVENGAVSDKREVKNQSLSSVGSKGNGGLESSNKNKTGIGSKEKGTVSAKIGVRDENQGKNVTVSSMKEDGNSEVKSSSLSTGSKGSGALESKNKTMNTIGYKKKGTNGVLAKNQVKNVTDSEKRTVGMKNEGVLKSKNQTSTNVVPSKGNAVSKTNGKGTRVTNLTSSTVKGGPNGTGRKREKWIEDMLGCDLFQGHWVKDESYPLYKQGSCPHIDEPFDCYVNGRPDRSYQKFRWQPNGCNIPRY